MKRNKSKRIKRLIEPGFVEVKHYATFPMSAWSSLCKTLAVVMDGWGVKKTTITLKNGKVKVFAINKYGKKL